MNPARRSRVRPSSRDEAQASLSAGSEAAPWAGFWPAAVILALGGFWLLYFFAADAARPLLLSLLVAPELFVNGWFGDFQQPAGFFDRWPLLAVAMLILLASWELGRWLLVFGGLYQSLTRLERSALAIGGGLNALSLYALVVGLTGLLPYRGLLVGPIVIMAAAAVARLATAGRLRLNETTAATDNPPPTLRFTWLILGCALPFVAATLLGGMLPPWDFDVREYHLQVPKEWWQAGRITFLPHNVYGNMPLGAELHALLAMAFIPGRDGWWWGALAGKLVMAVYAPLTAALLYAAGRRWLTSVAGAVAALVFVSSPWMVHTAGNGLNEPAVAFYVLAALYLLCAAPLTARGVVVVGFFAGAAAACKYPAVLYAVAPLAGYVLLAKMPTDAVASFSLRNLGGRLKSRRRWALVGCCGVGVLAGCGLWYAKNGALTGNPVYPLAYQVFGGATRAPEKNARWERAHQVPRTAAGARYSAGQVIDSLSQLFVRGRYASPLLPPLMIFGAVAALARWRRRGASSEARTADLSFLLRATGLLLFITAVWWLLTHRLERFWLPALPLAALLAGYGVTAISSRASAAVLAALIALATLYCGLLTASPMAADNRWFVALAALRSDEPRAEQISRVPAAYRWLNANRSPGQAVLLVGDATPFDLDPPLFYNTCFDDSLLAEAMLGRSPAARRQWLRARDIGFVYVNWNEIARYRSPGNYGYDPRWTPELLAELVRQRVLEPVAALTEEGEMVPATTDTSSTGDDPLRNLVYRVPVSER